MMVKRAPNPHRNSKQSARNLSDAVGKVINLANAIRRYWEAELPKRHPDYPVMKPGEKAPPPPPQEKKLAELLNDLSDEQLYQIALLMDLGRGYFDVQQLPDHYHWLTEEFPDRRSLLLQLSGKATLADYLEA